MTKLTPSFFLTLILITTLLYESIAFAQTPTPTAEPTPEATPTVSISATATAIAQNEANAEAKNDKDANNYCISEGVDWCQKVGNGFQVTVPKVQDDQKFRNLGIVMDITVLAVAIFLIGMSIWCHSTIAGLTKILSIVMLSGTCLIFLVADIYLIYSYMKKVDEAEAEIQKVRIQQQSTSSLSGISSSGGVGDNQSATYTHETINSNNNKTGQTHKLISSYEVTIKMLEELKTMLSQKRIAVGVAIGGFVVALGLTVTEAFVNKGANDAICTKPPAAVVTTSILNSIIDFFIPPGMAISGLTDHNLPALGILGAGVVAAIIAVVVSYNMGNGGIKMALMHPITRGVLCTVLIALFITYIVYITKQITKITERLDVYKQIIGLLNILDKGKRFKEESTVNINDIPKITEDLLPSLRNGNNLQTEEANNQGSEYDQAPSQIEIPCACNYKGSTTINTKSCQAQESGDCAPLLDTSSVEQEYTKYGGLKGIPDQLKALGSLSSTTSKGKGDYLDNPSTLNSTAKNLKSAMNLKDKFLQKLKQQSKNPQKVGELQDKLLRGIIGTADKAIASKGGIKALGKSPFYGKGSDQQLSTSSGSQLGKQAEKLHESAEKISPDETQKFSTELLSQKKQQEDPFGNTLDDSSYSGLLEDTGGSNEEASPLNELGQTGMDQSSINSDRSSLWDLLSSRMIRSGIPRLKAKE